MRTYADIAAKLLRGAAEFFPTIRYSRMDRFLHRDHRP